MADLFRLPYEGFMQGPGAFVGGVTRGMGSLLKHVSTGKWEIYHPEWCLSLITFLIFNRSKKIKIQIGCIK